MMTHLIFVVTLIGSSYYSQTIEGTYKSQEECNAVVKLLAGDVSEGGSLVVVEDDYSHIYTVNNGWKLDLHCKAEVDV